MQEAKSIDYKEFAENAPAVNDLEEDILAQSLASEYTINLPSGKNLFR